MFSSFVRSHGFAILTVLAAAGWSCSGVSEEARLQSQADVNLGRGLYADEHDVRGAIVAWERAIRRDPENAEAHLYLGQVLGSQGLFTRAEPHLREAVRLYAVQAETDETRRGALAESRNSLGVVLINLDRFDDAIAVLRAATEELTYGSQHLAWGNLGLALLRKGSMPEAVAALQRAVSLQAGFCVGHARLGEAYLRLNDQAHALESLDAALNSTSPGCNQIQSAWRDRARVRIALHQPERAREDIDHCVAIDAASPEGQECAALGRTVSAGGTP